MEDTKLLYDTIDARAETILRAADRLKTYIDSLKVSEVNAVNTATDLDKKLDQKKLELARERERYVKLDQSRQLELKHAKEEIERLKGRIRELERRHITRHDLPSENELAGSSHVHGSTTFGSTLGVSHRNEDYEDQARGELPPTQMDSNGLQSQFANETLENDQQFPVSGRAIATKNLDHASGILQMQQDQVLPAILTQEPTQVAKLNRSTSSPPDPTPPSPSAHQNLAPASAVCSNPNVALPPLAAVVESSQPPAPVKSAKRSREAAALEAEQRKLEAREAKKRAAAGAAVSTPAPSARGARGKSKKSAESRVEESKMTPKLIADTTSKTDLAKTQNVFQLRTPSAVTISASTGETPVVTIAPLTRVPQSPLLTSPSPNTSGAASTSSRSRSDTTSPSPHSKSTESSVLTSPNASVASTSSSMSLKGSSTMSNPPPKKLDTAPQTPSLPKSVVRADDSSVISTPDLVIQSESELRSRPDPYGLLKSAFDKTWSSEYRGRSDKLQVLLSHIDPIISRKSTAGNIFYISGMPGSGKTGTLCQLSCKLGSLARVIHLNCMRTTSFAAVIAKLCKVFAETTIAGKGEVQAKNLAMHLDRLKPSPATVVILDEISDKCKNSHQMVKEVFQWVATVKNHPLIVIGVANVLVDVSDSAFRDFVQFTHIPFEPYTKRQLREILHERLKIFAGKHPETKVSDFITDDAISLIAERAANRNGDARHAVDMCQSTLKTVRAALMRGERKAGPITEEDLPPIVDPFRSVNSTHLVLLSCLVVDAADPSCIELDGVALQQRYHNARVDSTPVVQSLTPQEFTHAIDLLTTQGALRAKSLKRSTARVASSSSSAPRLQELHDFSYSLSNVTPDDVILKGYTEGPKLVKKYFATTFPQFLASQQFPPHCV